MTPERLISRTATLLVALLISPTLASAETVVARRRMGNNTESITYDPRRDRVLAIDGNDVIAIALNPFDEAVLATSRDDAGGISGLGYRKIFDVNGLPFEGLAPRGLVYVPAQDRFYFSSVQPGVGALFSTDGRGKILPQLDIRGLSTPEDIQEWEGLAWIPPGAPAHGGTIAALAIRGDGLSHLFFIRLDGTLETELVPQTGTPLEGFFCSVQYWPRKPGTVLMGKCDTTGEIWAMDIRTGMLVGDPSKPVLRNPQRPDRDAEGIVVRSNGEILVNTYEAGRLFAYDAHLLRNPKGDRLFSIGAGASVFRLTWNSDTQELIGVGFKGVFAIPLDLRSARVLFDLDVNRELDFPTGGVAYLGGNLMAIGNRADVPGIGIAQLDPELGLGFSVSRLMLGDMQPPLNIVGFGAYGPDQFLVRVRRDDSALKVISRTGTRDTSIYPDGVIPTQFPDLPLSSPTEGFDAQVFDAGDGTRIFTGTDIYDGNGTLLHHIDVSKLGLTYPPLRNGVWVSGNLFAAVDGPTSTIILYTVP